MERFDAVVVGAGPAGSTTAYRLSRAGARVVLLDRAHFPRDKPCGGGLTVRALRELPFGVEPVAEDTATRFELRLGYGRGFERQTSEPLVVLTQRSRLDQYLVGQAAAAGAEFRDGARVTAVEADDRGVVATVSGERIAAAVLIGADGANGIVARLSRLAEEVEHGVALEGNIALRHVDEARFRGRLIIHLAAVPGGYSWVFPKGDHVNVGVGGWGGEGPRLRAHLDRLCAAHGLPTEHLEAVRGHRLPMRRAGARLSRGRIALVGDAAGLVDPLTGDGMYEAFLSGRLASEAALDLLAGRAQTLEPYGERVGDTLARLASASWGLKVALDRYPRLAFAAVSLPPVWSVIEAVTRGDLTHPGAARGAARAPLGFLRTLATRAGDPGRRFRPA